MARDVDGMCEKYELKLRAGRIQARLDGDRTAQLESVRRAMQRCVDTRNAVKEVLNREGIFTIWWHYYYDFAMSVAKQVSRLDAPDVLRLAARSELEIWVQRGLERSVLEKIGREVFDLDLTGQIQALAGSLGPT